MSTHHAEPGEIVDLQSWADDLPEEHSKAIIKSRSIELARLVIKAGEAMHPHRPCRVDGAIVLQCFSGAIELRTGQDESVLKAGQLVYLDGGTDHSITGVDDAVILLTIVFHQP